jgi:hypothetical protein
MIILLFIVGICGRTYIDLFAGVVETIFQRGPNALGMLVSSVGVGADRRICDDCCGDRRTHANSGIS